MTLPSASRPKALLQSHKELENLNRAKTKAVNHISHELKTPLAVVQEISVFLSVRFRHNLLMEVCWGIITVLERNLERLFGISKGN